MFFVVVLFLFSLFSSVPPVLSLPQALRRRLLTFPHPQTNSVRYAVVASSHPETCGPPFSCQQPPSKNHGGMEFFLFFVEVRTNFVVLGEPQPLQTTQKTNPSSRFFFLPECSKQPRVASTSALNGRDEGAKEDIEKKNLNLSRAVGLCACITTSVNTGVMIQDGGGEEAEMLIWYFIYFIFGTACLLLHGNNSSRWCDKSALLPVR